jgi:hypothetical protein
MQSVQGDQNVQIIDDTQSISNYTDTSVFIHRRFDVNSSISNNTQIIDDRSSRSGSVISIGSRHVTFMQSRDGSNTRKRNSSNSKPG